MASTSVPQGQVGGRETKDLGSLARAYFDAFNRRDFDAASRMLADDIEVTNIPLGVTFRGVAGQNQYARAWIDTYSDAKLEILNVVCQGDLCVVEMIGRGTHTGTIRLPDGKEIAPTNRVGENRFCDVLQFRDGKIVRDRIYYDLLTALRNVGVS